MNKVHLSLLLISAVLALFSIPAALCEQEITSDNDNIPDSLFNMLPYDFPTGHGKYKPVRHPIPNSEEEESEVEPAKPQEDTTQSDASPPQPIPHAYPYPHHVEIVPWTKSTHRGRRELAGGNSLAFTEKGPFSLSYVIHSKAKGVDILLMSDKDYKNWIRGGGQTAPIYIKKFSKTLVMDAESNSGTILSDETFWFVIYNNPRFGKGMAVVDYEVSFLPTSKGLSSWVVIVACCVAGILLVLFLGFIVYYDTRSERGYYRAGRYDEKYFERTDRRRDEERAHERERERDKEKAAESGFQIKTTWHTQVPSKDERQPLNQ